MTRMTAFIVLTMTAFCAQAQTVEPRNIILMIGDGMGVVQVTAGRTVKGGLALEKFSHLGLLLTHASGDDYVTDSAAGATALSTGVTTRNGMIAMAPDSTAVETVLEKARKRGKQTGLVVACSITHATPASFAAHVPSRSMQLEIAGQMAVSGADLLLGGGWGWFLPASEGGRRKDGRNLLADMKKDGYTVVLSDSAWNALGDRPVRRLVGLFAENHVGKAGERSPSLADMTRSALARLSAGPDGLFLMVEGSQIDWGSHDNQSDYAATEMADFDDAVEVALQFAEGHPGTLIVVTADHETGGFALVGGSQGGKSVVGKFVTGHHTAAMVPLFAHGPGAERFTGIRPNRDVGAILKQMLR